MSRSEANKSSDEDIFAITNRLDIETLLVPGSFLLFTITIGEVGNVQ